MLSLECPGSIPTPLVFFGFSDSKTSRPGASFLSVFLLSYALLSTWILFVFLFKDLCRWIMDHQMIPPGDSWFNLTSQVPVPQKGLFLHL